MLQVFLLMFAGMRQRNISVIPRTLLWLAYLLADFIAVYILGHMSFSSKSHEKQQLMAFWAPFLLVHLGGQDTITAYSIEDNQLWPRHLLTFVVQALGVAYVLYKYIGSSRTLVTAAALMFVTGVLKYGERIWALKSASLENMSKFLDGRKLREVERAYKKYQRPHKLGPEEVLQGAHDLLPICIAQFVDYKFWPSPFQSEAVDLFFGKGHMYELIEMQLSLVHDFLYTKAVVVFTWYGCFIRAISSVATVTTFFLFQSSIQKHDLGRGDIIITYILISGAIALELIALLKAMGSTWTCALLHARGWYWLHNIVVSIRRYVNAAEKNRRWSGSIGQPKPLHGNGQGGSRGWIGKIAKWFGLEHSGGCKDLLKKLQYSLPAISDGTKELVLGELRRMVLECHGKEDIMRSYSGQCALNPWNGFFEDPASRAGIDFDDKILAWYVATKMFLSVSSPVEAMEHKDVVEAMRVVYTYMIFLLAERPYMLPSPVRPRSYTNIEAAYVDLHFSAMKHHIECIKRKGELHKRWEELDKRREGLDLNNIDIRSEAIELEEIMHELEKIREELMEPDRGNEDLHFSPMKGTFGYIQRSQELERRIHELDKRRTVLERKKMATRMAALDPELDKINVEKKDLEKRKEKLLYLGSSPPPALARGADLMESLVYMEGRAGEQEVRHVVLGVWMEMLCYAAHHCSRDSHARQLNSGSEFITIVWLLSTTIFNHQYCGEDWFNEGVKESFGAPATMIPFPHSLATSIRIYLCRIFCRCCTSRNQDIYPRS
uniref:Uncharacterized protein n=1 Tax=Avena sativa TaxID=4498 RepID=A0ACD5T6J4_AVESA